ncbi:photosystem II biogenesis protein Psp29 [Microcoleus sp. FACHB-1515]|uniref:photosystem II biogenesis protein Psp29 n=1 Tax=Cyanophyceae TaxID=3028117 RepID=UPI00168973D3|nr:photosystem II biogenesis protein Psp29 [Microcoleus sp. FACHB-1515]MBD2088437.1 photosystem II biogenesis protein Psp29 [Microcoleus sp. FACHB-1515]
MNHVRTVSDTKRAFYAAHTRPINSIYRRVVEELMVEMHLLSVNVDFRYDALYALGVVTTFDRFMQGYQPDRDKESIFNALCQAVQGDPHRYRQDAERLQSAAAQISLSDLLAQLPQPSDGNSLVSELRSIAAQDKFKYSRLFAVGVYALLEQMDADLVKDEKRRNDALGELSQVLHLPADKVQKDLELYRSNLEKITQAQIVMQDILKADRKKKEERAKAKDAVVTPPSDPT